MKVTGKTQTINGLELEKMDDGFPDLFSFVNYDPEIGVQSMQVSGAMGSGKTEIAMNLDIWCMYNQQEAILMPADRFCEWRHFLIRRKEVVKNVTVIVPKGLKIHYFGDQFKQWRLKKKPDLILEVPYTDSDQTELNRTVIKLLKKQTVIAIYDAHLSPPLRAMLWAILLDVLLARVKLLETAVVMHFNEAGTYFPQYAQGKHWQAVQFFSQKVVDCRKGLVRLILISQLKSEIEASIRKKLAWSIYRRGVAEDSMHRGVRESVPFTPINKYHLAEAGLYRKFNTVNKLKKFPYLWKMIPLITSLPPISSTGDNKNKPKIPELLECQRCSYIWTPRKAKPKKCPKCKQPLKQYVVPE